LSLGAFCTPHRYIGIKYHAAPELREYVATVLSILSSTKLLA